MLGSIAGSDMTPGTALGRCNVMVWAIDSASARKITTFIEERVAKHLRPFLQRWRIRRLARQ